MPIHSNSAPMSSNHASDSASASASSPSRVCVSVAVAVAAAPLASLRFLTAFPRSLPRSAANRGAGTRTSANVRTAGLTWCRAGVCGDKIAAALSSRSRGACQ